MPISGHMQEYTSLISVYSQKKKRLIQALNILLFVYTSNVRIFDTIIPKNVPDATPMSAIKTATGTSA